MATNKGKAVTIKYDAVRTRIAKRLRRNKDHAVVMWKQFLVCGASSIDKDEGTSCAEPNTPGPAVVTLGGESSTVFGLSGVGDTFGTCFGPLSRNRQVSDRASSSSLAVPPPL